MGDRVSIVIPNHNSANFLGRTVSSVLEQTYDNIEIVIVDDGSTDNSAEVCMELKKNYKDIILVLKDHNEGQTLARNDGLKNASGDWIVFLDSDDVLPLDAIEKYISVVKKYKVDIVFSGYETVNSMGEKHLYKAKIESGVYSSKKFGEFMYNELPTNVLTCIGSKMYSMDFIRNKKTPTDKDVKTNYDMAFIMDALISCDTIYYLDEINYTYILRNDSITYSYRPEMYEAICYARRRIPEYLHKCGCYDEKKLDLELMQYSLIRNALNQEIKFKKGYSHFRKVLAFISLHKRTQDTITTITNSKTKLKYKIFMRLVSGNHPILMYALLKMKGIR